MLAGLGLSRGVTQTEKRPSGGPNDAMRQGNTPGAFCFILSLAFCLGAPCSSPTRQPKTVVLSFGAWLMSLYVV